eukprot:TRINITY_DN66575_c0_g1_i2.p1 TRINITY_DN66575_c0_g1~~TRINITY_DN66575_c0_g1_i2.p1  ORF type:complete len:219 (-),score=32.53 TRINITY_DN66575_c0_g1_i2:54-710(-)
MVSTMYDSRASLLSSKAAWDSSPMSSISNVCRDVAVRANRTASPSQIRAMKPGKPKMVAKGRQPQRAPSSAPSSQTMQAEDRVERPWGSAGDCVQDVEKLLVQNLAPSLSASPQSSPRRPKAQLPPWRSQAFEAAGAVVSMLGRKPWPSGLLDVSCSPSQTLLSPRSAASMQPRSDGSPRSSHVLALPSIHGGLSGASFSARVHSCVTARSGLPIGSF